MIEGSTDAVRTLVEQARATPVVIAFAEFYDLTPPALALSTVPLDDVLRHSPVDWSHHDHGWADRPPMAGWYDRLSELGDELALDGEAWAAAEEALWGVLARAAATIRSTLVAEGSSPPTCPSTCTTTAAP